MNRTRRILLTSTLIAALLPSAGMTDACSRAQIDHYLDLGYSLARITRLCSGDAPASPAAAQAKTEEVDPATAVYLQTAIDADKVEITADHLALVQERCFPYGETGYGDIRPSACVVRTVTIPRKGLKIGEVVEARFLLRDGKLMVHGDIRQQFSNTEKLRKRELQGLRRQYPEHLREFDVPVKPAMKRKKVAEALEKLAK